MKKLALLFGLLVASCNQPNVGTDQYQFGKKQYENSAVAVSIVTYKTKADLLRASRKYGVNNPDLVAFSLLSSTRKDVCEIHMIDPSVKYQPDFVGHEFLHCVYGQWHTNNDSRS